MKFFWISRSTHDSILRLLSAQIAELKHEREILLDRLATLGLGGPLFQAPPAATEQEEREEEPGDPNAEWKTLRNLRRRPSKQAELLTRMARRERSRRPEPQVAWIPQVQKVHTELDEAEAAGRTITEELRQVIGLERK